MKKDCYRIIVYFFIIFFVVSTSFSESITSSLNDIKVDLSSINISSPVAFLVEKETGDILYEKGAYEKMYPASTTKMLTAILVLEKAYLNEVVTVSQSAVSSVPASYTTASLQAGEQLRVEDLLYAMMIPSGNDAANVLAEHVSGSITAFAELMNKKAEAIGAKSSHFTNPSGIHDANLYTTAYDLSLIARYAMNIEKFREIVRTESYTLPPTNLHPETDRSFENSNLLLDSKDSNYYYEYTSGIKTGFTDLSGDCLVASAKKDNIEFIAVCLKSGTLGNGLRAKFLDCKTLFDFGFANYTTYYSNLQAKNDEKLNIFESLFSSPSEEGLTEPKVSDDRGYSFDFYRAVVKITAVLIIALAVKFLFFRKKKNRRRRFSKKWSSK